MFVRNRTPFDPVLARGHITDDLAALSLNLEVVYQLASDGTLHLTTSSSRLDSDPPDICRRPLWRGVSVTAFGQVHAPVRPPHLKVVQLSAGDLHHRLVVFGARRWRKAVGQVVATEPMPFDSVPLDWEHAFGGFFDRPAGYSDDGKLPHPGGRMVYGFNPDGVGFYPHADAALEQPLPRIERQDMLVRSWSDRPVPGGLAPCPRLAGLRVDTLGQILDDGMRSDGRPASPRLVGPMLRKLGVALRQQHHATRRRSSRSWRHAPDVQRAWWTTRSVTVWVSKDDAHRACVSVDVDAPCRSVQ
jgi:hypothetical protein